MGEDHQSHPSALDQLSPEDQEALAWMGILHGDGIVQPAAAAIPWAQSEAEARQCLGRLHGVALIQCAGDEGYRLDGQRHAMARQLMSERRSLREAHAHLLERYRAQTRDGLWHTLPDNGYIHEHLTWHMEQAGWEEEIHALLREEAPEGRNGWYEAREALHQTSGYLADVTRARRIAGDASHIGLQCRYALLASSIHTIAGHISSDLLLALVNREIWTAAQGLAYAREITDPARQAQALGGLASYLTAVPVRLDMTDVLAVVREIDDDGWRVEALVSLAPHLPEPLLKEAWSIARGLGHKWYRVRALVALVPHLAEPLKTQALERAWVLAHQIGQAQDRVKALTSLATHLSPRLRAAVLADALAAARTIGNSESRYSTLENLIPQLQEELREQAVSEALATARTLPTDGGRADALVNLVPYAPEPHLLTETRIAVRSVELSVIRATLLARLVPYFTETAREEVLSEALAEAWSNRGPQPLNKADALGAVAAHLSGSRKEEVLDEALDEAREADDCDRPGALKALVRHLSKHQLAKALTTAREIEHPRYRVEALVGLVPYLPEPLDTQVLIEAMEVAQSIGDEQHRLEALDCLLLHEVQEVGWFAETTELSQPESVVDALPTVDLGSIWFRREQWRYLAPRLATLPSTQAHRLWREMLRVLAKRRRSDLLSDLRALAPAIAYLGGPEATAETAYAIQDAGRWWP